MCTAFSEVIRCLHSILTCFGLRKTTLCKGLLRACLRISDGQWNHCGISESELSFKLFLLFEFQRVCSACFQHVRNLLFSLLGLTGVQKMLSSNLMGLLSFWRCHDETGCIGALCFWHWSRGKLQLWEADTLTELTFLWLFFNRFVAVARIFDECFSEQFVQLSLCVYKTCADWDGGLLLTFHFTWECFVCLTPPLNLITSEVVKSGTDDSCRRMPSPVLAFGIVSEKQASSSLNKRPESTKEECDGHLPDVERDDMLVRRMGTFQRRTTSPVPVLCPPLSVAPHLLQQRQEEAVTCEKDLKTPREAERSEKLWASCPVCVVLAWISQQCCSILHTTLKDVFYSFTMACVLFYEITYKNVPYEHETVCFLS